VRAFLHFAIRDYQGPAQLLSEVNQYVTRDSSETSRFMSLFFLEFDPSAKTLRWVRAGHEPAMVYDPTGHTFQELSGEGLALGVVEDYSYKEYTLNDWSPGRVIMIGTDGVHETRNEHGEMFGLDRLRDIISKNAAVTAETMQNAVIDMLRNFQGSASQEDDITLVIVKLA
jgi:sigma-B regulation protein RsbU (phosphoserine phosphatase)